MSVTNTIDVITEEIGKAFIPLKKAITSKEDFEGFMLDMGWGVKDIPVPIKKLGNTINKLETALKPVISGGASLSDFIKIRQQIKDLFKAISALKSASFDPSLAVDNFASKFPKQLVQYLFIEYLTTHQPKIGFMFKTLGIIREIYKPQSGNRPSFILLQMNWKDILKILSDPQTIFENAFGWGTSTFDSQYVFQAIQDFMISLGVPAFLEELDDDVAKRLENNIPIQGDPVRWNLTIPIYSRESATGETSAGFKLYGLPKVGTDLPGLAFLPYASGDFKKEFPVSKQIFIKIISNLNIQGGIGIKSRPKKDIEIITGLNETTTASTAKGNFKLGIVNKDKSGEPIVLIGDKDGSRLEYKTLSLVGGLYLSSKKKSDLYTELELVGGKIVIKASEGDSFLKKILPKKGITGTFDLAPGISSERGFYFRGSGGLEISLSSHVSLGPVELQGFTIGIKVKDGTIPINLGADVKAELGPLTITVKDMGITATFSFPDSGGNLGPVDLDLDFKPPKGIGLSIDGQGFKGGGFLSFDSDNHRYTGVLELEFQKTIALKAVGLLTTKLPGGKDGFSLLIVISAEFTPIQLGYGFTLNGVGGLLGLNRTMKVEPLRKGLKANTLKSILFPTDVIKNCNQIISDLRQVFPPQEKCFVFGPMAKIGWGTPTLIDIDLGLIIEIPNPVRIALLGVVKVLLPDEKLKLLSLQVNFLGVIDFGKKQLSFDASLYDSKIMRWPLTGDMALRLCWGDNPNFLLTVGGFHPAYNPPVASLKKMERLTVYLLGGKNPRITLESYFAVTSNTVQFGAKLELYAAAWKFNVYGFMAFDVLFQFSPFYFIASISAMLAVRIGSASLFSISLALSLSGPTPWNAKGTASFKIFFFITVKIRFNKTFGKKANTSLPSISILPKLEKAIKAKGNWQAEIPSSTHLQVSVRKIDDVTNSPIVHPMGTLEVSQKVLPLDLKLNKIGNQKIKGPNKFTIKNITSNKKSLGITDVKDYFARAQYIEMKDAERLSRKSFEKYNSGAKITASEDIKVDHFETKEVKYELIYLEPNKYLFLADPMFVFSQSDYNCLLKGNAISKCTLSHAKNAKSQVAPEEVTIQQEQFAVVNTDNLSLYDKGSMVNSEAEALDMMTELIEEDPGLAEKIQVVPKFEVSSS